MDLAHTRALVIVNRKGTRGKLPIEGGLRVLADAGIESWVMALRSPRRIGEIIRANAKRFDLVIIGGGDGTLSAAADALFETGLPFGIWPMGNANDLARTLGIAFTVTEASQVITAGHLRRIDLGRVNGRHFFNVASIGLSVTIADRLSGDAKRRWGIFAYLGCAWEASRAIGSFRAQVTCDGSREEFKVIQIAVGNGRHYGGGMTIVDDATIDDGRLDLYALPPCPRWRLIALAPALRWGRHRPIEVIVSRHGRAITIETAKPMAVNVDGEVLTRTPADFSVVPEALSVFAAEVAPGLRPIAFP